MADYNSGLPIRSEADGVDEKVLVKLVDGQMGGSNQMRIDADNNRSEERRVGKECRSRWSPYH
jgi:hypothetical protein